MRRLLVLALAAIALGASAILAAAPAAAATIQLDRSEASPGETITVTMEGFALQRAVVIAICGNEARRGSIDCDLPSSQGYGIRRYDKTHQTRFRLTSPPMPCPCVVQVSDATQGAVAYAPIVLRGVAVAPVVGRSAQAPLRVDAVVKRVSAGLLGSLRASLGGPTRYDLIVKVRNQSARNVEQVKIDAYAGRGSNDRGKTIPIAAPSAGIASGQTWTRRTEVKLPAPSVGSFQWVVSVSGDGEFVQARLASSPRPWLLYVLLVMLVADLAVIAARFVAPRVLTRGTIYFNAD